MTVHRSVITGYRVERTLNQWFELVYSAITFLIALFNKVLQFLLKFTCHKRIWITNSQIILSSSLVRQIIFIIRTIMVEHLRNTFKTYLNIS